MAGGEDLALDEAALFLGPGRPVRVDGTGAPLGHGVRTAAGTFPAVPKRQRVHHHRVAPGAKVIVGVAIVVTTQTTQMALVRWGGGVIILIAICERTERLLCLSVRLSVTLR